MQTKFYYLFEIQYLGFRYHGWQQQPNVKTVQEMVLKTLHWILPNRNLKVLAAGRTDAKVSANQTYIEVFLEEKIQSTSAFLILLNENLPQDIRALSIRETHSKFNIIQSPKIKEYHYFFAFGEKFHPFSASLMCNIMGDLDILLMQDAAKMFVGEKDFYSYTFRPKATTQTLSEILSCEIIENTEFTASFFPKKSFILKVKGMGFKRNQIRLMMGILIDLGRGETNWKDFIATLDGTNKIKLTHIAPASGLQLYKVHFINSK